MVTLLYALVFITLICAVPVVFYLEVSTLFRSGRMWKPWLERALVGLAAGLFYSYQISGSSGEAGMLAPLFGIMVTATTVCAGYMLRVFYGHFGRAILSKPRSPVYSNKETQ